MDVFKDLLVEFVERRVRQSRERKRDIAARCGYKPSSFSQLMSGRLKAPRSSGTIITIAKALELDLSDTNRLLVAAGFSPVSVLEQVLDLEPAEHLGRALDGYASSLAAPDREALAELMKQDATALVGAWKGYLALRDDLYARLWPKLSEQMPQRYHDLYWPLRRLAARFYSHLALLEAASEHHTGAYSKALRAAGAALDAARIAEEPMVHCRCHVRLADINKALGHFTTAEEHYRAALEILDGWIDKTPVQSDWVMHWQARIGRKWATLYLFRGQPERAVPLLDDCIATFRRLGSDYELSRANYALGWAYSHLGRWEGALALYKQGLGLTEKLSEQREDGRSDPRQLLEGYLCLATVHWQLASQAPEHYEQMEEYLEQARVLLEGEAAKKWGGDVYHEVGRYHLLWGRLQQAYGGTSGFEAARQAFARGIAFHLGQERRDPARLASLHIAAGLLEQQDGKPEAALTKFEEARRWAESSDPPNTYYLANVSVYTCAIQLKSEEFAAVRTALITQARKACLGGRYWGSLAYLELICAKDAAQRIDEQAILRHSVQALVAAAKFNGQAVRQVEGDLDAMLKRLSGGRERRLALGNAIREELDALEPQMTSEESGYLGPTRKWLAQLNG